MYQYVIDINRVMVFAQDFGNITVDFSEKWKEIRNQPLSQPLS